MYIYIYIYVCVCVCVCVCVYTYVCCHAIAIPNNLYVKSVLRHAETLPVATMSVGHQIIRLVRRTAGFLYHSVKKTQYIRHEMLE